jgi:hypothetical protein
MHLLNAGARAHSQHAATRSFVHRGPARVLVLLLAGIVCLVPILYTPEIRTNISISQVRAELGKAYLVRAPSAAYGLWVATSDSPYLHRRSQLALSENGIALGPANAPLTPTAAKYRKGAPAGQR